MSYPKKSKGWRTITVDGRRFRWHFDTGSEHAFLKLQSLEPSGCQAIVSMRQWHDVWLNFQENLPPNEPGTVTAKFARQAVLFALAHGWEAEKRGPPMVIEYADKSFSLAAST